MNTKVFDANMVLGRCPRRKRADRTGRCGGSGASPNINLETSTSSGDGRTIESLVETAGEELVLFGSDMPKQDVHYQLGRVVTAAISMRGKQTVLGLNAVKLLNFGE